MKQVTICILATVLLFTLGLQTTNYAEGQISALTPTFTTIDISSTPVPTDFPYGITCTDNTYVYVTIFSQGQLGRIDKSTNAVTLISDGSAAAGRDWYSLVTDPNTGKIYINEKDSGLMRIYNPSGNSWATIPIPENVAGGVISYETTYASAPNKVKVNEGGAGFHQYDFGFGSFGELKFTNGFVWELIDYNYDFANTVGETDVVFHGIAKINPADNSVTRYSILGASALRGMAVDVNDPTILWITDNNSDKLFKFDTNSNTVTQTITLPSGSNARGIADDGTNLYIAKNVAGGLGENSQIIKVVKSNSVITTIDTGAINSGSHSGTFSVYVSGDNLLWTDQSSHIGNISISNNSVKSSSVTSGNTDTNHFGCVVGTDFWFSGHGSAKVGTVSLSHSSESNHGDSCAGDCYSPFLGNDEDNRYFYSDGLTINGISYEIKNELHNHHNETINLPVGRQINMTLKGQDSYADNINNCEVGIGIKKGHFIKQDATFILGLQRSFDGTVLQYVEGDSSAYRNFSAKMFNMGDNVFCEFLWTPTKHLEADMFALELKDIYHYFTTYFVNDGIEIIGYSEVGTPIYDIMDSIGHVETIAILDKTLVDQTRAIDTHGNYWTLKENHWTKDFMMPDRKCDVTKQGYDRYCPEFGQMKKGQELIAKQYFNSELIQAYPSPIMEKEWVKYERLHDPIPNMMKARADYESLRVLNQ